MTLAKELTALPPLIREKVLVLKKCQNNAING